MPNVTLRKCALNGLRVYTIYKEINFVILIQRQQQQISDLSQQWTFQSWDIQ